MSNNHRCQARPKSCLRPVENASRIQMGCAVEQYLQRHEVLSRTWFFASTAGPAPGVGDSAVSRYSRGDTCSQQQQPYNISGLSPPVHPSHSDTPVNIRALLKAAT